MREAEKSSRHVVVAVDGPAASGKGTLARAIAAHLGFSYLDTGALYRAVAYQLTLFEGDADVPSDRLKAVESLQGAMNSPACIQEVLSDSSLRTDEIGLLASKLAHDKKVRASLLGIQRDCAQKPHAKSAKNGQVNVLYGINEGGALLSGAVLDGRDIGTVVCPDAEVKLYITAEDGVRAERRKKELHSRGIQATYEAVLKDMRERDARDAGRETAPMKAADDAHIIDTSGMSAEQVMETALNIIREKTGIYK